MRTETERNAIADHLTYELAMLWRAPRAIESAPDVTLRNCAIEALALHARNLIDFFYTDPQKDDVAAAHFFSDPNSWPLKRPTCPDILETVKTRANKEVSHLTYARLLVPPDARHWPAQELLEALDAALKVFCDNADLLPERVRLLRYRELLP